MKTLILALSSLLLVVPHAAAAEKPIADIPAGPVRICQARSGQIMIAVTGRQGVILTPGKGGTRAWKRGNVGGLAVAPNGDIWITLKRRVLRYKRGRTDTPAENHSKSFRRSLNVGAPFVRRDGTVMVDGCRRMRLGNGQFTVAAKTAAGENVVATCDDSYGNLWGVVKRGKLHDIAVTNIRERQWRSLGLSLAATAPIQDGPCTDDVGGVWFVTTRQVVRIDPQKLNQDHQRFKNPSAADMTAVARVANEQVCVGFADGTIRVISKEGKKQESWTQLAKCGAGPVRVMLHGRRGFLWVVSGEKLFRLNQLRSKWQTVWDEQPRMPAGNHDHIFARVGDKLYTAGGKTYFGYPADQWLNLDHIWSYDIRQGSWQVELKMLEAGKSYSGIAALNGEIWLLGGYFRTQQPPGIKATSTVEIFNPKSRKIRRGPSLKEPRGQVVGLTVDKRLYAIGGGSDKASSNEVVSIGIGESSWRKEPPAPGPVTQASGCVLDGKVYVAAPAGSKCRGLFQFDPTTKRWRHIERTNITSPQAPLCTAHKGEVWVLGGLRKSAGQVTSSVYSPKTGKWRQGPKIPLPVSWGAAASVNGRLLISGGAYREPRVKDYFNSDRVFLLR